MSLKRWLRPHISTVLTEISAVIAARSTPPWARPDDDGRLRDLCGQHLSTGGKRLRALLPPALVAAEGGDTAAACVLGACIEVLHNGTLVHDDIQDGDELRRGQPTLWRRVGAPQAINAGDVMLVAPLLVASSSPKLPVHVRATLAALLAGAVTETIRGQVGDLDLKADDMPTLDHANGIALAKTAPLFAACLEGAVILLDGDEARRNAAREIGRHVGVAFQVRDDLLDVLGVKGRGAAGADLREGKPSWPVLAALVRGPEEEAEEFQKLLDRAHHGYRPSPQDVEKWLAWVNEHGGVSAAQLALDESLQQARDLAEIAFPKGGATVVGALCDRLAELDG
ncbi:MAG: polyprenyl synthetase family protein [Myxococcales bacterium]|nr:polyprenyl synthetase family protein [Myxococcales bacterium]